MAKNATKKADASTENEPSTAFGKWLKKKEIHPQDFAQEMELSLSYVNALRAGSATPSAKLRLKIQERSNGAVRFDQW
jgi:transcriptional regulator with XRE-family HTH domain